LLREVLLIDKGVGGERGIISLVYSESEVDGVDVSGVIGGRDLAQVAL
jgi:hypothetical protein